jgi:HEAT repeat protein
MAPVLALEPLRTAVLVLAGLVILLSAFLLIERSIAFAIQARIRRRESRLTRLVYEAVQSTPVNCKPLSRLGRFDRKLVRSILLRLALDLRGDTGEAICAVYTQLGFLKRDLKKLRSWRASTRTAAAADLGSIHAPQAASALLDLLDDSDARVRQAAVWSIGQAGRPAALAGLVRLLGDRDLIVAHRAQEVLAGRGREVADTILSYAETTASRPGRLAAIQLLGWLRISTAANLLLVFMTDMDPEVRVKSVKAAATIGDPRFLEAFHACLEDTNWAVRCQAAKGLSLFASPESVGRLTKALRDKHWWVRFYAATALAEIGSAGEAALTSALNDPEPTVRDMARYLLERGQSAPALP